MIPINKNLLILSLFLFPLKSFSQLTMPKVEIKSPQSYAFEKYGNVPVSLYTGAIDLKVPITTIGENDINIPVTLTYDSSGFIPHKKSDAAGMGWSMLAGGRITRNLNGTADEYVGAGGTDAYQLNPYGEALDKHGFLKGVKTTPTTNTQAYNVNGNTGNTDGQLWWMGSLTNNPYEGEPDEFSFNAMGISGKFIVGNDGNVLVESDDPNIKVDLSQMALYGGKSFCVPPTSIITLTDGNGTKYIFGGDLSKYEISYSYSVLPEYPNDMFGGHPMISSFSLSKVIFTNGREIIYDYEQDTFFADNFCHLSNWFNLRDNSKILSMDSYNQDGGRLDDWKNVLPNGPSGNWSHSIISEDRSVDTFVMLKKSVLKSIKYVDDEIKINYIDAGYPIKHFTLSPFSANKVFNEWVIDNVETYHKNTLIKKAKLSYDHLGGEFKRPFLKSVTYINSDQTYSFEYYKTNLLPPYYTKGIDHWGYWNSNDNNTKLFVFDTYNEATGDYTLNNTVRDANAQNYDVALLKKITYPTKGFSIFEYEPQYYSKRIERISSSAFLPTLTNNGGLAGGARIKKISSRDENGVLSSEKEYKYTSTLNSSISSGILMNWPRYVYAVTMTGWHSNLGNIYSTIVIKSSSNVQKNSLDSYNIGYSKVFEIENNKGYIEHNFTTYETHPDLLSPDASNIRKYDAMMNNFSPPNLFQNFRNLYGIDKSILRGRPLSQKYFSQIDLVNPIKKVDYEYYDNMDYNPNNAKDNNNYVSIHHLSGSWVQGYRKFMNQSPTKKITTTDYLNNTQIITKSESIYDSPLHLNLSRTNATSPDNSQIQTTYRYARGSTNPLVIANMMGIPLEVATIKNGKTISRIETKYENPVATQLLPSSVVSYDLNDASIIGYDDVIFEKYDNQGNLQQYSNKDGVPTTIIWGYNKTKPIAKIKGAKLSDVQQSLVDAIVNASTTDNAAAPNNDEITFLNQLNTFRKHASLSTFQITTYTYDPLVGIRTITPPSGLRENYLYDTANRLSKITDINGHILQEYKYNFNPNGTSVYHNTAVSKIFRNLNCNNNTIGSPITYSVPANQYTSNISQADADYKAEVDLNTNGQALANVNSVCTPINCPVVFNSSSNINGTSSVYADHNENFFVFTFSFTTGSNSTTLPWDGDPGVKIATINGNCRPADTILGGTMQAGGNLTVWWSVRPNGDIYIDNTPAPANNSSQTWVLKIPIY